MEEALLGIVTTINNYLSNYILIILLLGMGIWFTVRTKAIQFRCFGEGWRRVFGDFSLRGGNQGGGMTSFQALSTAIAAQVGTGNIVGACGAIIVGGPGAIFWMWIAGLFGIATKYVETCAAVKYRVRDRRGQMMGGAMFVWKRAFARPDGTVPWWATLGAVAFAAFAIIATIGTGSAVQAAAMFVLSGGVRVLDLVMILLTAAVLLLDKIGGGRR